MKVLHFLVGCLLFMAATAKGHTPAVHGMVLFGDQLTMASHLPMFHHPHDYQLILELIFSGESEVLDAYENLKEQGHKLFTIASQPLDLASVSSGETTTFNAHLYQGHFEQGGHYLGTVLAEVRSVVYAKQLDPNEPNGALFSYLIFGHSGEYFAVHVIKGNPSFDQILKVSQPQLVLQGPCQSRYCPPPSQSPFPDENLPIVIDNWGVVSGEGDVIGSFLGGIHAPIEYEHYFEDADLSE